MQVSVEAQVLDVEKQKCELTNTFQFTFKAEGSVPFVMPKSYADGIVYLNGRRHFNRSAHEKVYSSHSFFA
ncbi:Acyl-coenzyme A thioesterase 10, mitochondrial [Aphelenchoides besseyi]|nr:Acyl-coenzyme A thioesterase 10, mitochondrial [Aphelenchoides besseyi]